MHGEHVDHHFVFSLDNKNIACCGVRKLGLGSRHFAFKFYSREGALVQKKGQIEWESLDI